MPVQLVCVKSNWFKLIHRTSKTRNRPNSECQSVWLRPTHKLTAAPKQRDIMTLRKHTRHFPSGVLSVCIYTLYSGRQSATSQRKHTHHLALSKAMWRVITRLRLGLETSRGSGLGKEEQVGIRKRRTGLGLGEQQTWKGNVTRGTQSHTQDAIPALLGESPVFYSLQRQFTCNHKVT